MFVLRASIKVRPTAVSTDHDVWMFSPESPPFSLLCKEEIEHARERMARQ